MHFSPAVIFFTNIHYIQLEFAKKQTIVLQPKDVFFLLTTLVFGIAMLDTRSKRQLHTKWKYFRKYFLKIK